MAAFPVQQLLVMFSKSAVNYSWEKSSGLLEQDFYLNTTNNYFLSGSTIVRVFVWERKRLLKK